MCLSWGIKYTREVVSSSYHVSNNNIIQWLPRGCTRHKNDHITKRHSHYGHVSVSGFCAKSFGSEPMAVACVSPGSFMLVSMAGPLTPRANAV